jgi:hypothetical protein
MNAPERIHNVSHSQFSIARYYGGIKFNGYTYIYNADDDTLTRKDIAKAAEKERKAIAAAERKKWQAMRDEFASKQVDLEF